MGENNEEDGSFIIKARGLPWSATAQEVQKFFHDCNVAGEENGIHFTVNKDGRPSGECFVELSSQGDMDKALKHNKEHMGTRYIEIQETKRLEMECNGVVNRMSSMKRNGLHYGASKEEMADFFAGISDSVNQRIHAMNGTTDTTMETDGLPKIHLPGEEKFQSYKTSLQDYCLKKRLTVPQYLAEKETDGLLGTVSFGTNYVKCAQISGSMKEADSHAAFEALSQLGYLEGQQFETQRNQLKRKDGGGDEMETNAKQIKPGTVAPITYKSHLNQIVQKKKLGTPCYNTVTVNGGFFSTVTIGENQFKSMSISKKRKDAEQDAAQVALNVLNVMQSSKAKVPLSPSNVKTSPPNIQTTPTAKPSLPPAPPPVGLKNRLQEFCQKGSITLPVYETQMNDDDRLYQATVTVDGFQYSGLFHKGKKPAEASAAEAALKALGLVVKCEA